MLYKEDLNRAFHQLFADPQSISLLGYKWRGKLYFDCVMMMGCRIAPYICQRTTDIATYIQANRGFFLLNYVDDFIGAEYHSRVLQAHRSLTNVIDRVGLIRSEKKLVKPTHCIEFIGNLVDTVTMTVGIIPSRQAEIVKELEVWRTRRQCSRGQLESLVGKLQFISNCVKSGRLFIFRLLEQLCHMKRGKLYNLSAEARRDIKWWYLFVPQFDGTSVLWLLDVYEVDAEFATDACLLTMGAVRKDQYIRERFP